jgi:hypothetical protein
LDVGILGLAQLVDQHGQEGDGAEHVDLRGLGDQVHEAQLHAGRGLRVDHQRRREEQEEGRQLVLGHEPLRHRPHVLLRLPATY